MPLNLVFAIVAVVAGSHGLFASIGSADEPLSFKTDVQPVLAEFCFRCHGPDVQKARIRLDTLSMDMVRDRTAAETWQTVLHMVSTVEMPPEGEPQPDADQRNTVKNWLRATIDRALQTRLNSDGRTVLRRLNRTEYQNTMRDLFDFDTDYVRDIPPDGLSPDGFRNNGSTLRMTAIQLEYYFESIRKTLDRVIVTGPAPEVYHYTFTKSDRGDGEHRKKLVTKDNRIGRSQVFLARMVPEGAKERGNRGAAARSSSPMPYPEEGDFLVRVRAAAEFKEGMGLPVMEVKVGYRPDTEVLFRTAGTVEVISPEVQRFEFRGRIENFPLPVRGQGKYPGLIVRIENVYDDGNPAPEQETIKDEEGRRRKVFPEEPNFPKLVVESVEFIGPLFDRWPPQHHRRILFDSELYYTDPQVYAREVLSRFMARAWRRPVDDLELDQYVSFFNSLDDEFPVFEERMRETLAMVLISPNFLFLLEPAGQEKRPLDCWELASRLSYFLWATMPDDRLFELAQSGRLIEPDVQAAEVDRMIEDERAWRFVEEFTGQWLDLGALDRVAISRDYYPNFNDSLKDDMRAETQQFFMELLRGNRSAWNLVDSDFTMLNENLARHYGIEGVRGHAFRRVPLGADSLRGGLLTQAAFLLGNSTGEDSHPIKRAVWIRRRLLDDPPDPPPADVPELDSENPEFARMSVREQLQNHRQKESCAQCHVDIDPWGFALEHYDAVGRRREVIRRRGFEDSENTQVEWENYSHEDLVTFADSIDVESDVPRVALIANLESVGFDPEEGEPIEFTLPVDAQGTLPDGTTLHGVSDLRKHLMGQRREDVVRAVVTKFLAFALGRSLEFTDQPEIDRLSTRFVENDLKLRTLVHEVIKSDLFQKK